MTGKADFTEEEWELVLGGPPSAGFIVVTAQRGGTFRESIAMAKAYTETRKEAGGTELVDQIVSLKPERDHTHYHSVEELKAAGLQHLRDAVAVLAAEGDARGGRGLQGLRGEAGREGGERASGARPERQRRRAGRDRRDHRGPGRSGRLSDGSVEFAQRLTFSYRWRACSPPAIPSAPSAIRTGARSSSCCTAASARCARSPTSCRSRARRSLATCAC